MGRAGAASGAAAGRGGRVGGSASGALRYRRRSAHRLQGPAGPRPVSGAAGSGGGQLGEAREPLEGGARPRLGPAGGGGLGSA